MDILYTNLKSIDTLVLLMKTNFYCNSCIGFENGHSFVRYYLYRNNNLNVPINRTIVSVMAKAEM